jgi:hypothetical protein
MPNQKISQLTGATTPLGGSEELPIVQSGATKKVSIANVTAGRAVSALSFAGTDTSNLTFAAFTSGAKGWQINGASNSLNAYITGSSYSFNSIGANESWLWNFNSALNIGSDGSFETRIVVGGSAVLRAETTGNVKIDTGNLVIGTSGKGIDFAAAGGDILTQYDEYTAASTACQNAITTACVWKLTKIGNQVTITLPKVTGTAGGSNVNFVLGANIPSAYRPTADIGFYGATIINNGAVVTAPGFVLITTGGTIIVYRDAGALTAWTNGATAGLNEALGISWTI